MPTIIWGILQQTAGAERESLRPHLELGFEVGAVGGWFGESRLQKPMIDSILTVCLFSVSL